MRQWEDELIEIDAAVRNRLYILTVAAEKGWRVAGDLAFGMKGNFAKRNSHFIQHKRLNKGV